MLFFEHRAAFVTTSRLECGDLRTINFKDTADLTATYLTGAKFDDTTVLPDGWTKDTATQRGMVFAGANATPPSSGPSASSTQSDVSRYDVKSVPDASNSDAGAKATGGTDSGTVPVGN